MQLLHEPPLHHVERLETLAVQEGSTLNEVVEVLLNRYAPVGNANSALVVAKAMEAANILWIDEPDVSINSRDRFEQHMGEQRYKSQHNSDPD